MFVLDTNTLIYYFKGAGRVGDRLLSVAPADVAIPAIVLYELEVGVSASLHPAKRRAQLVTLLSVITVLPFDWKAAEHAGRVRGVLRRSGNAIGPLDTLIAGTAIAHGATLVTHVREFRRVPGLSVVDWY